MSSRAWIEIDQAESQRAKRILALIQERESRDELGLDAIRNSIANDLFPRSTTIQNRLQSTYSPSLSFAQIAFSDRLDSAWSTSAR